jgi:hypothetical protein
VSLPLGPRTLYTNSSELYRRICFSLRRPEGVNQRCMPLSTSARTGAAARSVFYATEPGRSGSPDGALQLVEVSLFRLTDLLLELGGGTLYSSTSTPTGSMLRARTRQWAPMAAWKQFDARS